MVAGFLELVKVGETHQVGQMSVSVLLGVTVRLTYGFCQTAV